jgi:hypothetical protein
MIDYIKYPGLRTVLVLEVRSSSAKFSSCLTQTLRVSLRKGWRFFREVNAGHYGSRTADLKAPCGLLVGAFSSQGGNRPTNIQRFYLGIWERRGVYRVLVGKLEG